MSRSRAPEQRRGPKRLRPPREWVGGLLSPPFFIDDREEPYRVEIAIWIELPEGLVVGRQILTPDDRQGAFARVLVAALEKPLVGPRRTPDLIRVADASLAAEVRGAIDPAIRVRVGDTPELDELLELMLDELRSGPGDEDDTESYVERGRIAPPTIEALFAAAEILYRLAPWEAARDDRVLRMDIPALCVDGACVSIIGSLGQSRGLIIFPSLAGYHVFATVAESLPAGGRIDLGTGWLALTYERKGDLPATMREEAAAHAWPVASAKAYPRVERRDRDGATRPLVERDLEIVTACAAALPGFFVKHQGVFEGVDAEPVCESYLDDDDLEVRFTMPYEALALFDVGAGPALPRLLPATSRGPTVGRNDPCPCGSGRKYKKCHLPLDEQARSAAAAGESSHQLDHRLRGELAGFAARRFGDEWRRFADDFNDAISVWQISEHWSVYHYRVAGRTVLDWYLDQHGWRLSPQDHAWLVDQRAAWLSVWEVTAAEPGVSLTLRDLLTGEVRKVRESTGSRTAVVRDAMLGRVVDHDRTALLCGVHPRALPPSEAAAVVERARSKLRRRGVVPVERLRDEAFGRYLIKRWEEAVAALDAKRAVPPVLQNTDGDPLLFTMDHYRIAPGARPTVEAKLAALEGVEPAAGGEDGEGSNVYVFVKPGNPRHASWDNTLIGRAVVTAAALVLETNSRERANALRARVESACGDSIRHRAREHVDPLSMKGERAERGAAREQPPPPEAEQLLLEFKRRHYADWPDQTLPALNGMTPREAVRTRHGRALVDVLLKDMENGEQRSASRSAASDFSAIRRVLGID